MPVVDDDRARAPVSLIARHAIAARRYQANLYHHYLLPPSRSLIRPPSRPLTRPAAWPYSGTVFEESRDGKVM
jgi:hypothetical protein